MDSAKRVGNRNVKRAILKTMEYFIKHKFRENIVVPYVGIYPNIFSLTDIVGKTAVTSDHKQCTIMKVEEVHICEVEGLIYKLYNMTIGEYLLKWYNIDKAMQSMFVYVITLKKQANGSIGIKEYEQS